MIQGEKGEFTVLVGGREGVRKTGDALPPLDHVVSEVRNAEPALMATPLLTMQGFPWGRGPLGVFIDQRPFLKA